ncbi:MAG: fibrillarin-like rRNA/tRNA 2'-O-methyltransferase [Archaeoglobaceae archaeon]|nr:fibrillarin-like rRNA/tRNA 2'-O-methyltransferase [Archaeoglobaceae archaeon]
MKVEKILHNVYLIDKKTIATKSSYGSHYGEKILLNEFREWIPYRSKLAAVFLKGYLVNIKPDWKILYLGAASGTTVSHLSDIIDKGMIYAVEYSAKPFLKFIELAKERKNIIPILEDASKPWMYSGIVEEVDFVYQDIAQKNQVEIFKLNCKIFLKERGEGIIMVKARSIDSTVDPEIVFNRVVKELSKDFKILRYGTLEPFHKDHVFVHVVYV